MIRVRKAKVREILKNHSGLQEILVSIEGEHACVRACACEKEEKALVYPDLTGEVQVNDEVWLNTTAVDLSLGTGGYHFVMAIISREARELTGSGHIMKLRYTPWQLRTLAVEEESSPSHREVESFRSLAGIPVVVGSLHSMIAPVVMAFKEQIRIFAINRPLQVVYIMTDGAALPIAFSRLVMDLKDRGLIDTTITCGHAFGGDLEAVNVYSALASARAVCGADLIVVAMGPGIVGTGTKYGFTGIEETYILEAVERMGGTPVIVPRISFADSRPRHRGVSHHTQTVLELTYARVLVGIPEWNDQRRELIRSQLLQDGLEKKHHFLKIPFNEMGDLFAEWGMNVTTMGRSYREDPAFFDTAGVAGKIAAYLVKGERGKLEVF